MAACAVMETDPSEKREDREERRYGNGLRSGADEPGTQRGAERPFAENRRSPLALFRGNCV